MEAVLLADLLWPYVADIEVDAAAVALSVGDSAERSVAARLSSGNTTPYALSDTQRTFGSYIRVVVGDASIVSVALATDAGAESLVLTARAPGTTTVSFEVLEGVEAVRLPAVVRAFPEISVTVA